MNSNISKGLENVVDFKKFRLVGVVIVLIVTAGIMSQLKIKILSDYIKTPICAVVGGIKKLGSICNDVFANIWDYFKSVDTLRRENERLKEIVAKLSLKQRLLEQIMLENKQLKELLKFNEENKYNLKIAKIIGFDSNSVTRSLLIEKVDDLSTPAVCIGYQKNRKGLIGRVEDVNKSSSVVVLITDRKSMVSGLSRQQQIKGVLKGDGYKLLTMNYVPKNADIRVGDEIVTAGDGGVFPPFIPIGTVIFVDRSDDFLHIWVKPYINPYQLNEVFVLTPNK